MCSSWSKPFVTSLTPGLGFARSLKQHHNGPKWKVNIWRYWTFDMYLILQKWLNSSFPPLGSVPFFLSRSLFFFSIIIFYCHSQDSGCLAIFFSSETSGLELLLTALRGQRRNRQDTAAPPARAVKALRLQQAQSMWFHNPASRTLSG